MFYMNHPAPGFGDLLPGFFVVPQNPFEPMQKVQGIGDLIPGRFIVPQNPLRKQLGLEGDDCGCGCSGSGGCSEPKGVGFLNGIPLGSGMGNLMDDATAAISGNITLPYVGEVPTAAVVGVGVLLLVFMGRGDSGNAYRSDLAKLRSKYPTRASRVRRAVSSY